MTPYLPLEGGSTRSNFLSSAEALSETEVAGVREEFAELGQEDTLDQVIPIVGQIQKSAASGNGPLFVADQQPLDEKLLGVFYRDVYGKVMRHSAMEPEGLGDKKLRQEVGCVADS
ncbi:hypothetical protein LA080_012237 [Diaporthe eres]|nr:hypothetical protein LA080_012237 [Diaporthe eres]